jgi:hypothetical protein
MKNHQKHPHPKRRFDSGPRLPLYIKHLRRRCSTAVTWAALAAALVGQASAADVEVDPLFSSADFVGMAVLMGLIFFTGFKAGHLVGRDEADARAAWRAEQEARRATRIRS